MIAHIYPSVLQAVSGRGYAGCLDGCFQGYRGEAIQDLGYGLRRIPILRTPVNKSWFGKAERARRPRAGPRMRKNSRRPLPAVYVTNVSSLMPIGILASHRAST